MIDLGSLHYFLDLQGQHTTFRVLLHQTNYDNQLLNQFGMKNQKLILTSLPFKIPSLQNSTQSFCNPNLYRQLADSLQYLTIIRLDITFVVNKLCYHIHHSINVHYALLKWLLHYLKPCHLDFPSLLLHFILQLMQMLTNQLILLITSLLLNIVFFSGRLLSLGVSKKYNSSLILY